MTSIVAHVRQTAQRIKDVWLFLPPKTEKGRRDVYYPAQLYHRLQSHYASRAEARRLAGARWQEHGLLFPALDGQPLHQHGTYTGRFRRILKAAGLGQEFTPYSLRYSFATLALLSGELDKTVSEQMGHRHVDFTKDVYVQVLPEMRQAAADKLERLLFAETRTPLAHIEAAGTM